jgi:hypothetical protein
MMIQARSGNVGIGTINPGAELEIAGGGVSSLLLSGNLTDATRKFAFIQAKHFTNSEEPIAMIGMDSQTSSSVLYIGGGLTSSLNAATEISFQTAANNTTVTGTERMKITPSGRLLIGSPPPAESTFTLDVVGTGRFSSSVTAGGTIRTSATSEYYADSTYLGTTYNFGPGEATDNVDFKIAGGGTWTT